MASIELRTPKNKPAYYKITASITLNGQTIRKFSRFEFDPKTLKTAKQRVAAATAAAFEFEAKAQEEAERSLSGANKPFQEVAEEFTHTCFAIPLSACSCRILTSVLQRLPLKQVTPSRARL